MRRRSLPVGALLLASALLGTIGGAAAAGAVPSSTHPSASGTITISVGNGFSYSLSSGRIEPGTAVTVTLISLGTTAHTFTLSAIPNFQFNSTDSDAHLAAFFAAHPPLINLSVNGSSGERHSETITAPSYGEYEFVCLQSGHFAVGMSGFLGSGEDPIGISVDTGPGWPVFAIGGGIAALVVATIVLAFVVGQRPGGKHEMPPERLGYPERPPEAPHR